MKLIGLMLVRNEAWVIGASVKRALEWCDELVVFLDQCTDDTLARISSVAPEKGRIVYIVNEAPGPWNEMDFRQKTLAVGRSIGGTHFAIIDGDEILTSNLLGCVHRLFEQLDPGETLELPMVPLWLGFSRYRDDDSVWARARITLGFRDDTRVSLTWAPRDMGYQHHCRAPFGSYTGDCSEPIRRGEGGVFHLQFSNRRRLVAKHWLYAYTDYLRWPERRSVEELNRIYSEALKDDNIRLSNVPHNWVCGIDTAAVKFDEETPWQETALRKLLADYGEEKFKGIRLALPRPV